MKKNVLALSIATMVGGLGFAGVANAALNVKDSGAGHILVVPYYSAQNGNMSVFHVTNTDMENGKAVKVRFRGASNSDDVLDFQVFLSPGDVWTAAVTQNAEGRAQLTTADNSCTVPKITPNTPVPFVVDRLTRENWTAADKNAQTLEGYVEILTMADIPPTTTANGLYKAIKHVNGVAPCTLSVLDATLELSPKFIQEGHASIGGKANEAALTVDDKINAASDLVAPGKTGSLLGQWYVMNVAQTTTFSGETTAIEAVLAAADAELLNVFSPQKPGTAELLTADPLMVANLIPAQHYDVPDLSTPYEPVEAPAVLDAAKQAIALTDSLLKRTVINQYATDKEVAGKTDWVFSMPTRRYTIAANYEASVPTGTKIATAYAETGGTVDGARVTSLNPKDLEKPTEAYRVINKDVTGNAFSAVANSTVNAEGQICVVASGSQFLDREETKPTASSGAVFSPGTYQAPQKFSLCGEVSVLAFSDDESALGAKVARQVGAVNYANGWGSITFGTAADATTHVPVLGSAFIKLSNPEAAPGTSGTYGLTWAHAFK